MKYIYSGFFIIICQFVLGQNEYIDIIQPRLSFVHNVKRASDSVNFVVLNKTDTLYPKYKTDVDLSYLNASNYSTENIIGRYKILAFQFTTAKSKKIYELKQWNTPIIVFMDDNLPKEVIKKFKTFYSQIKGIPNLSISFTNNLENSNYFIKTVSKEINGYDKDFEFYSEEDRLNSPLTGGTYFLQTDKNNKLFAGILSIHIQGKNEFAILKQLKQLFFMSLGSFAQEYLSENSDLTNKYYANSGVISTSDLEMLKIHYGTIYDRPINGTIFNDILKLSNPQ